MCVILERVKKDNSIAEHSGKYKILGITFKRFQGVKPYIPTNTVLEQLVARSRHLEGEVSGSNPLHGTEVLDMSQ